MVIDPEQISRVLGQFNPWWSGSKNPTLPGWHRAAFPELIRWIEHPPTRRAILLSGARQVGKTTLVLQAIMRLLERGVSPGNILYATFDHPLLKLAGIEAVISCWREREARQEGPEYLFLDEAQYIPEQATWLKHQIDLSSDRIIIFTGSAMPLLKSEPESGVGRWHTIRLTTLSFYEYLRLKEVDVGEIPCLDSLHYLFTWPTGQFLRTSEAASTLTGHFHGYLLRGGFPQLVRIPELFDAQRLLREDIVDKVLKRDMTALYGVRNILEMERLFLYLCLHDGGILNLSEVSGELGVSRATVSGFLDLLEAAHLLYRLPAFGYGKEVLRGRQKVYLADPSIAPAVMLLSKSALDDPQFLGNAVENAVFKHLYARLYRQAVGFSYWRGKRNLEVDLVGNVGGVNVPFEIKYRNQHTDLGDLAGLLTFCQERKCPRGYVITRSLNDFGVLQPKDPSFQLLKIPAPLLCYWTGRAELHESGAFSEDDFGSSLDQPSLPFRPP